MRRMRLMRYWDHAFMRMNFLIKIVSLMIGFVIQIIKSYRQKNEENVKHELNSLQKENEKLQKTVK